MSIAIGSLALVCFTCIMYQALTALRNDDARSDKAIAISALFLIAAAIAFH